MRNIDMSKCKKLIGRYDSVSGWWNYGYFQDTRFIIVYSMPGRFVA